MAHERILIADDEPDVLDIAVRALVRQGYRPTGVPNGAAAVAEARRQRYDLFVTDVKMPGMSGLRAYQLIKAFSPDTLGLIITGYGTLEMAIEAVRLGVHAFILKPFGPEELCRAIARALEGRRLAQENARLRALLPLHELTHALIATRDLDALAAQVVELAVRETDSASCSLFLVDEPRGELYLAASQGANQPHPAPRLKLGQGIAGLVAQTGEAIYIQGALAGDGSCARFATGDAPPSALCLPLAVKGKPIGVICLAKSEQEQPFSEAEHELISILAGGAAVAIENARLFTDLQRTYERLAELDHRKSEFINLAAHELRSPLAAIITYGTLVQENTDADENTRTYTSAILQAASQLHLLLNDMLNLHEIDAGATELRPEPTPLPEAINQVLPPLARMLQAKRQTLSAELPDGLPPVFADPRKLQIILLNLLSNAIKFTPEGGRITIQATPEGEDMVISVHDTGIGIPESEQDRVFERFYQVADSLRREQGGLGLGLSIAKGMVEVHGGRMWVESRVGIGSAFYFTLPCWQGPAGQARQT